MQKNYTLEAFVTLYPTQIGLSSRGFAKGKISITKFGRVFRKSLFSALFLGALAFSHQTAYAQSICSGVTPTAKDDGPVLVAANTTKSISAASLLANDGNTGNVIVSAFTQPANGTLEWEGGIVGSNIIYTPKQGFRGSDKFTYTVKRNDSGAEFFNGHYYEFIRVPEGIAWDVAKATAGSRSYNGLKGYLTNITTPEENNFVMTNLDKLSSGGRGWIGASDAEKEGEWKWVGGPEAGTIFYNHSSIVPPRTQPQPGFSNWLDNDGSGNLEPNNAFGIEHSAYIMAYEGRWNDYPHTNPNNRVTAYVVEYGIGQNCSMTATASINLVVASASFATNSAAKTQDDLLSNDQTQLQQNYPNPFQGQTKVNFTIKQSGYTSLKVYNVLGQEVKTLFDGPALKGEQYEASFEGKNLSKGVYMYTLITGSEKITKRMFME